MRRDQSGPPTSIAYKRCVQNDFISRQAELEMTGTVSSRASTRSIVSSSIKKSTELSPTPTPCHWNGAHGSDEWQMNNSQQRRSRDGKILLELHERVRNDPVLQLTTVEIEDILQQVLGIVVSNSKLRHEVSQ